jgi:hypothetical protein
VANITNGHTLPSALTGEYTRHGSKLTGPCTLLLVHRGTTTTAKAHTFALLVHPDGRRSYVSSVWDGPTPGTYALEHKGIRYALTLSEHTAQLVPVAGGTGYSSVPPVAKTATIPDGPQTPIEQVR